MTSYCGTQKPRSTGQGLLIPLCVAAGALKAKQGMEKKRTLFQPSFPIPIIDYCEITSLRQKQELYLELV